MFTALLIIAVIPASLLALRFALHFSALGQCKVTELPEIDTDRYRPMLRLLSDPDLASMKQQRNALAARRALFREYLRALTADYGRLLAGIRLLMVSSEAERPDLAKILMTKRLSFALAVSRIEFCLVLHALGLASSEFLELEVFGLLDASLLLRRLYPVESAVWGA